MNKLLIGTLLVLSFSMGLFSANAQETISSEAKIKQTVLNYYEGYIYADLNKLALAFDTLAGHMKYVKAEADQAEKVGVVPANELIKRWAGRGTYNAEQIAQSGYKIESLDILDDKLAMVKIALQAADKSYIDYLALYRVNGEWKIVNKVFVQR